MLREFVVPAQSAEQLAIHLRQEETKWQYDARTKRYRDTSTGRFVSHQTMVNLRDEFIQGEKGQMDRLSQRLFDKDISITEWENEMRGIIRRTHSIEYMMGRGGRNMMTQSDWGRIGSTVRTQYQFLSNFSQDIVGGRYNENQIAGVANRMKLYVESASQSFERGRSATFGVVNDLPAQPADGSSICRSNDRCFWRIVEREDRFDCFWEITAAESCETCIRRNQEWYPFVINKVR